MTRGGAASADGLEIVQVVRRMHPLGGVGGVALALQTAFAGLGVKTSAIVAGRARRARGGPLADALEIIRFTLRATGQAARARARGAVVVVHGDALGGDLYVDHGLHRALVRARPWLLLHPLHLFIALRESLRHARGDHRAVACLSGAAEAALRHAHPSAARRAVVQLRNGVDLARFRPSESARQLDPAQLRLCFVGHEFGRKGLDLALAALTQLPGARLQVLGGSKRAVRAARRIVERLGLGERVQLLGVRSDVAAHLTDSDLLVLPSAWEAAPMVVLEAFACGVPAVLADAPWAAELIATGGAVGAAREPPALAAAIRRIGADAGLQAELRRRALAHAAASSWTAVAQDYVAVCEALRASRTAP